MSCRSTRVMSCICDDTLCERRKKLFYNNNFYNAQGEKAAILWIMSNEKSTIKKERLLNLAIKVYMNYNFFSFNICWYGVLFGKEIGGYSAKFRTQFYSRNIACWGRQIPRGQKLWRHSCDVSWFAALLSLHKKQTVEWCFTVLLFFPCPSKMGDIEEESFSDSSATNVDYSDESEVISGLSCKALRKRAAGWLGWRWGKWYWGWGWSFSWDLGVTIPRRS